MKTWKLDGSENDKIRVWLADSKNSLNCEECPYVLKTQQGRPLPCGQQNCWVDIHTS